MVLRLMGQSGVSFGAGQPAFHADPERADRSEIKP